MDDTDGAIGFVTYGVGETRRQVGLAKRQIDDLRKRMGKAKGKAKDAWEAFLARWDNFYQSTQGVEGAFTQFRDKTYARTIDFQAKAETLSKALDENPKALAKPNDSAQVNRSTSISLPNMNIGWDIPWKKILLWGSISATGIWVGHKVYQHYTNKPKRVVSFVAGNSEPETQPTE